MSTNKVAVTKILWNTKSPDVDKFVDRMVDGLIEANVDPVAYMAVDTVFRSYVHWVTIAQMQGTNADETRGAAANLMNAMTVELMARMVPLKEVPLVNEWIDGFLEMVSGGVREDLKGLLAKHRQGVQ